MSVSDNFLPLDGPQLRAFAADNVGMPINAIGSSVRTGSQGSDVRALQQALADRGFNPGGVDGAFGPQTRAALVAFQQANGLVADGIAGPKTWAALNGAATPAPAPAPAKPSDGFDPPNGPRYRARGTGCFPDSSAMEGGFVDRQGQPLHTLQDFLEGKASYVSVAMDASAFPYGTRLRIPELEAKYGRAIDFRVVDTGGAFRGKSTSRIDVCTRNQRASVEPTINGPLTLIRVG